jgi:aminoglycoside phosphotransferase (APT) family kinase protein
VSKWHLGYNPNFERKREHDLLAKDLARFLNALHGIKLANGPLSKRGIPLKERDMPTRAAINELQGEIDITSITALWEQLSNVPSWSKDPVWVHGDFLPDNILAQSFRLSAVIDFSMMGMGDPACDLIIAWSLLSPHSRKIFKDNLENIDEDTWERGRGWALSIALIMLSYYRNRSYSLTFLAKRMIAHVLDNVVELYIPPKRKKSKLFLFFERLFKK